MAPKKAASWPESTHKSPPPAANDRRAEFPMERAGSAVARFCAAWSPISSQRNHLAVSLAPPPAHMGLILLIANLVQMWLPRSKGLAPAIAPLPDQQSRQYLTTSSISDLWGMPISRNVLSSNSAKVAAAFLISRSRCQFRNRFAMAFQAMVSQFGPLDRSIDKRFSGAMPRLWRRPKRNSWLRTTRGMATLLVDSDEMNMRFPRNLLAEGMISLRSTRAISASIEPKRAFESLF
jgi:hypothetical protein